MKHLMSIFVMCALLSLTQPADAGQIVDTIEMKSGLLPLKIVHKPLQDDYSQYFNHIRRLNGYNRLELDNGSVWHVIDNDLDMGELTTWRKGDWIGIRWGDFPGQDFVALENRSRNPGHFIRVTMAEGPKRENLKSHHIVYIQAPHRLGFPGILHLEDGSLWQVHGDDQHIMTEWLEDDDLLVDVYEDYHFTNRIVVVEEKILLFNIRMQTWVTALPFVEEELYDHSL